MKLSEIREAKNLDEIKPAIVYLTENMETMTMGEFHGYRNTITQKAKEFGLSFTELNDIAAKYQETGTWS